MHALSKPRVSKLDFPTKLNKCGCACAFTKIRCRVGLSENLCPDSTEVHTQLENGLVIVTLSPRTPQAHPAVSGEYLQRSPKD